MACISFPSNPAIVANFSIGGKAKPLKAAKKAPKEELDETDKAFLEKKKAGTMRPRYLRYSRNEEITC